jgi:hypothetical protein
MKIELSVEQLAIIGQALEQGPYKLVAPVLAYLQKEINNHQNSAVNSNSEPPVKSD